MNSFEKTTTDGQTTPDAQPQKKAWITPAFEQVVLKKALETPPLADPSADGTTGSS